MPQTTFEIPDCWCNPERAPETLRITPGEVADVIDELLVWARKGAAFSKGHASAETAIADGAQISAVLHSGKVHVDARLNTLELARGLERLEDEIGQGTYQPARTPDRHLLAAQDIFRWLGK